MKCYLPMALAVAVTLTGGTFAYAVPIVVHAPNADTLFASDTNPNYAIFADDFVLGTADTVRSLTWTGSTVVKTFIVNFYADQGGSVGPLIKAFDIGTVFAASPHGGGSTLLDFRADLGAGIKLDAARYWLSIVGSTGSVVPGAAWGWLAAQQGEALSSPDKGLTWIPVRAEVVFALDNENTTPAFPTVPEPSALAMLGAGLAGLIRLRLNSAPRSSPFWRRIR